MTLPTHHLPDWLLSAYAAGAVSEGESLIAATHVSLCPDCRGSVSAFEEVGGALLQSESVEVVSGQLWERLRGKLAEPRAPRPPPPPRDALLPAPLAAIVGPYDNISWKRAFEGLYYLDLPLRHGSVPVRLRRLPPGMKVPQHTHRGAELELILAGGAVDLRDGRRFVRGDVASNDENDQHSLKVDEDGECLVLGVQDARIAPLGLWSRLVFGYLGW
jgi:putative transcriptional regulator